MKKLMLIVSLMMGMGVAQTATAADLSVERKGQRGCRAAKLTRSQKKEIRELRRSSKKDLKGIRANILKARKNLRKTILNANSTVEQAAAAQEALLNLRDQAKDVRVSNKLHILYNIAEVEQRRPLLRCMKQKRKAKKNKNRRDGRSGRFGRG